MRKERRWMTSLLKETAKAEVQMPWARGKRRDEWIAKRDAASTGRVARA